MKKCSAIILAGGRGNRLRPLTDSVPKPLLKIGNTTPLENTLLGVAPYVTEIILVIGYLGDKIKEHIGDNFQGIPIKYVWQTQPLGTGHALSCARSEVSSDSFFFVYGDDYYDRSLFAILANEKRAVLGRKESNWQKFGVFQLKKGKYLQKVVEKPDHFIGDLVNIGFYKLEKNIFSYFDKIQKSIRGELEFTDMLSFYAQDYLVEVVECQGKCWIPLTSLDDLKSVDRYLKSLS